MNNINDVYFWVEFKYLRMFFRGFETGAMAFRSWKLLVLAEDYCPNLHWNFFIALSDFREHGEMGHFENYPQSHF